MELIVDSPGALSSPRYLLALFRAVGRVDGLLSKVTAAFLIAEYALLGEQDRPTVNGAVPVRLKALGHKVWLRRRSADIRALHFLHLGHHRAPPDLAGPARHIAVFGAHIGLLLADLAVQYPEASLLGVEADPDNAALARRNLAWLGDRATLRETAVWYHDDTLTFSWVRDAWGLKLAEAGQQPATHSAVMTAVGARDLLNDFAADEPIDYLLINIESAWCEMLRHGEWTENVRCINIEIQDHYDEAIRMLTALGYHASLERLSWGAFVVGKRESCKEGSLVPFLPAVESA